MKTFQVPGTSVEIYTKLKGKIDELQKTGKLSYVDTLEFNDAAKEINAKGTGFKATLASGEGKIDVSLDLNLLMKALRGKIEGQLETMVQKIFG